MSTRRSHSEPLPDRPSIPSSYGIDSAPEGMLDWGEVAARLTDARNYWVCTTRPDGSPNATLVWGLWVEGSFYFFTDRASRKARNIGSIPRVVVHLESGDDVAILEGDAEAVTGEDLLVRLADAYEAKYGFRPEGNTANSVAYQVRPRKAFAWHEGNFPRSATRWRFERQ